MIKEAYIEMNSVQNIQCVIDEISFYWRERFMRLINEIKIDSNNFAFLHKVVGMAAVNE